MRLLESMRGIIWTLLLTSAVIAAQVPAAECQTTKGGKDATQSGGSGSSKPKDAVHDVVARTFSPAPVAAVPEHLDQDLETLSQGQDISWEEPVAGAAYSAGQALHHLVTTTIPSKDNSPDQHIGYDPPSCASQLKVSQSYIFHVTHWTNKLSDPQGDNPAYLISSSWFVYRKPRRIWAKESNVLVGASLTGSGDPLIYAASNALIVSIDIFDVVPGDTKKKRFSALLNSTYSITVTQGTPANTTDLGALIGALAGTSSSTANFMSAGGVQTYSLYVGATCQGGTKKLPYDMSISDAILQKPASPDDKGSSPQAPSPGNVVCSGAGNAVPCATNRSFTSQDREYWDVGIGIAIPGVRETKYTFSTTTSKVVPSVTTHTDVYALVDIFPFAYLVPKESIVPHFVTGIPLTSQSFYRPYFGVAENLTGWTTLQKKLGLPVAINFIAGMTYMKTQEIVGMPPTTQAEFNSQLQMHRVWKPIFGIEVPVSSVLSKIGGKGGSGKNANGSGKSSS
jgi:hypothetical protein